MKSPRQLQASRVNGAKSRGPVTAEGKRNTSQNAIRHGAFCKPILLKTESKSEFAEFAQSLRDEFQPRTAFESTLVDDMIAARWRATRFAIMEESLVDHEIDKTEKQIRDGVMGDDAVLEAPTVAALSFRSLADDSRSLDLLIRYGSHFGRQYFRAHKRLIEVQDRRRKTPPPALSPKVVPIRISSEDHKTPEQSQQSTENRSEQVAKGSSACQSFPVPFPKELHIFEPTTVSAIPACGADDRFSSSASPAEAETHEPGAIAAQAARPEASIRENPRSSAATPKTFRAAAATSLSTNPIAPINPPTIDSLHQGR